MAALFFYDLADNCSIWFPGTALILLQLPETAPVVEPLRQPQFQPGADKWDRFRFEPVIDPALHRFIGVVFVEIGDRQIVFGLFLYMPDHEFQMFDIWNKLQTESKKLRGGQFPI